MLKQRIITGLILVALLLAAIFLLPVFWFGVAAALVFSVGAWEWSLLAGFNGPGRGVFALLGAVTIVAGAWLLGFTPDGPGMNGVWVAAILALALGWWVLALWLVVRYPGALWWNHTWSRTLAGLLVLFPAWVALVFLRLQPHGQWLIIILVVTVGAADTAAYFCGRRWGRRQLAPHVSPGKTWEGFAGGLAGSSLFALVLILGLNRDGMDWWLLPIIAASAVVSVLGDLLESMLKREQGLKDSGRILPGHGGVLDRMDSVTAAAPVFTLAYLLSGWHL